ncbi:MAG: hypothetical protein IJX13_04345 [Clostridia bacterium]|nr:hypothetical protein [Clostridia bacterium]
MKKYIAVLLCLIMIISLISCDTVNKNRPAENDIAMQMYAAAINDEICVFDEHLGEIKLKACRFPSNNVRLDECKLLTKAILDMDQDGVNEYVIKSPDNKYIILRHYNAKVYSYYLDICDYYKFNTDGTFYWNDSSVTGAWEGGLNKIIFDGETLNIKSIYSLKYSENSAMNYEYYIEGEAVAEDEYYHYRNDIHNEAMSFSHFDLTCSYPITAEKAWDLANAYWDNQDGRTDGGAGTIFTARIVLIDTPNSDTNYYRIAFQVEFTSNVREGGECMPPYHINSYDQILVNAFTGEIIASTYEPNGKGISVEEAIEIAKNDCEYIDFDNEESGYRVEHAVNAMAPDHVYVIAIQKYVVDHYSVDTVRWVDKYTGEIISPYYVYGK